MARKDDMLRAFLKNQEFCDKYNIPLKPNLNIYEAQKDESVALATIAKIINKYDVPDTTSLYQQVINELNEKL